MGTDDFSLVKTFVLVSNMAKSTLDKLNPCLLNNGFRESRLSGTRVVLLSEVNSNAYCSTSQCNSTR